MSRHRRRRIGLFVSRATYMALWVQYQELLRDHRALDEDHQRVLEAHEGLLYDREALPEPDLDETAETPVSGPRMPHVPSWAETDEIPVITAVQGGLDPAKADALVRRTSLLDSPSGSWSVPSGENG